MCQLNDEHERVKIINNSDFYQEKIGATYIDEIRFFWTTHAIEKLKSRFDTTRNNIEIPNVIVSDSKMIKFLRLPVKRSGYGYEHYVYLVNYSTAMLLVTEICGLRKLRVITVIKVKFLLD